MLAACWARASRHVLASGARKRALAPDPEAMTAAPTPTAATIAAPAETRRMRRRRFRGRAAAVGGGPGGGGRGGVWRGAGCPPGDRIRGLRFKRRPPAPGGVEKLGHQVLELVPRSLGRSSPC